MPLLLGNTILLKERGGVRESIPRQVDKKFRFPGEERGSGALEEERRVWNSQGGEKDKRLFFSTYISLSHIKRFFFKPRTDDYTTNNSV